MSSLAPRKGGSFSTDRVEALLWLALRKAAAAGGGGSPFVNVLLFGAKPDGIIVRDASIGGGSNVVHSPSGLFKTTDVGKVFVFPGAGVGAVPLVGSITGVISATDARLSVTASTPVAANGTFAWGTDNAAAYQAGINATAGQAILYCPAGIYLFASGFSMIAGASIFGPDAEWVAALPPSLVIDTAHVLVSYNPAFGASTTPTALIPAGAKSFTVVSAAGMSVGTWLLINDSAQALGMLTQITAIVGTTVTIDRATINSFALASTTVTIVTAPPSDTSIEGPTITGSGSYNIYVQATPLAEFIDVTVTDDVCAPSAVGFNCNPFTYRLKFKDITVRGPKGLIVDSTESVSLKGYTYQGHNVSLLGTDAGLVLSCCNATEVEDIAIHEANISLFITQLNNLGTPQFTTNGLSVIGGDISGGLATAHAAIVVNDGARGLLLEELVVTGNAGPGLDADTDNGTVQVSSCVITQNGDVGAVVSADQSVIFESCDLSNNTPNVATNAVCLLGAGGGVFGTVIALRDCVCDFAGTGGGGQAGIVCNTSSGTDYEIEIDNLVMSKTGVAGFGIFLSGTAPSTIRLRLRGGRITMGTAVDTAVIANTGVIIAYDTTIVGPSPGASTGFSLFGGNTPTLRYKHVHFQSVTAPVVLAVNCYANQGQTVIAAGAAVVPVPWPDLQTGEMPKLEVVALPGAGGFAAISPILVALTPGTGFSIQGVAGNTATYQYEI